MTSSGHLSEDDVARCEPGSAAVRPAFPGAFPRTLQPRDVEDLILRSRPPVRGHPALRERVPPATTLQPVELNADELRSLLVASLSARGPRVVWVDAGDEVVVDFDATRVALTPGMVLVGLSLATDAHAPATVSVPVAIGTPERITGLHAVTPRVPEGPVDLVTRWGRAVVAAVWSALVDVVDAMAGAVGEDLDGAPLAPAAIVTDGKTFGVVPQARPTREQAMTAPGKDHPRKPKGRPTRPEPRDADPYRPKGR